MARQKAGALVFAVLTVALAACSSDYGKPAQVNPNVYPTAYKRQIIATLRELFDKNETTHVSNAMISQPVLEPVDKEPRYTLCIRYTAHGTTPEDIGNATRRAYFYGGQLNQLLPVSEDQCAKVAWQPFQELNDVCLGAGCQREEKKSGWKLF